MEGIKEDFKLGGCSTSFVNEVFDGFTLFYDVVDEFGGNPLGITFLIEIQEKGLFRRFGDDLWGLDGAGRGLLFFL